MNIGNEVPQSVSKNEAYMNILSRTSVRRFTDEPLSDDQITAIVHAAMAAPSGVNRQPWEFIVVDNEEIRRALADSLPYAKMAASAPLLIVVCGNKDRFLEGPDANLWEQDCSACSENILLAANALGLGAVWTCLYPHEDRMKAAAEILNLSPNYVPFNLIPIGHPAAPHSPMNKWQPTRVHII